ncbi:MAG TPA: ATP-binding protein [Bacteroidetes bacterium]|nr:ATP-binding protein [Bacteroidota bacterium]
MDVLTGRKEEQEILEKALASEEAEMVSITGRRRVGKTFLVNTVYKGKIAFEMTGIQSASQSEQLRNFANQLRIFSASPIMVPPPKDWLDAFFMLIDFLETVDLKKKPVVFFDEVPWIATARSGFLKGLSYFWNSWAVRKKMVVVICGSAASWMIRKILLDKGGLHNRVTRRIRLHPFNLAETRDYLARKGIRPDIYQLLQLYMAVGGIPHYLKEIEGGKSATQNIDNLCFSSTGLLRDEFANLYPALFQHSDYHVSIVRALASKPNGMTREQLVKASQLSDSGWFSKILDELVVSGFLTAYPAIGKKKKDRLYRLTDEYSLFYLRFIENNPDGKKGTWQALSQTQRYKIWCGYAFENICLKHVDQIKKALGIAGVYSHSASFFTKAKAGRPGVQIDLVIDRNDHIINLIEIKFHDTVFAISKPYAEKLRNKIRVFGEKTKTRKQLQLVFITVFGLRPNRHSVGLVDAALEADILFE